MEWILGAIGAVLFISAVGFLIVEGIRGPDRPGEVVLRIEEILETENTHLVRYSAYNSGSKTLADLHLSARLFDGTSEIDSAQAVLDFLPGNSTRRGGFYLREDPERYRLELRVEGYQEP